MGAAKLELVHLAIRSGLLGHIRWKDSAEQLVRNDPDLCAHGITPRMLRGLLRRYVFDGNSAEVREETRQEYVTDDAPDPFWYRVIVPFPGFAHGIFVEVKLVDDDPVEPWIEIVSAHRQES